MGWLQLYPGKKMLKILGLLFVLAACGQSEISRKARLLGHAYLNRLNQVSGDSYVLR